MDSMAPMPNAISSEDEVVVDSKLTADTYTDNKNEYEKYEVVLVVPQKLTMIAKNIIYNKRDITPLNYHLEGRFGSRIHRVDESHMGLPLYTVSLSSSDDNESLKAKEEEE
jgi:hypothetical protein